jgi:hypothetical protein
MNNLFDKWDDWVNSTEGSLVNFLTAFAPWLAPLAPAYMTYVHMIEFLEFPIYIAFPLALLVEILGFGTVSTALDFWFHNRKEKAGMKRAPIEVVIGVFIFYLMLILVSNVVIDVSEAFLSVRWQMASVIIVRGLLTLQTIPGALIVAVRTGHRELLKEIKREKAEKLSETSQKVSTPQEKLSESFPKDWRKLRPTLTYEQVEELANLTPGQIKAISQKHGVDEKTVQNWRSYSRREVEIRGELQDEEKLQTHDSN